MTNSKVNTQDIPIISRLWSLDRGKGVSPETFIMKLSEQTESTNLICILTIYDEEALQNDETQAEDDSNTKEKSGSSVQLAPSVTVQPSSKGQHQHFPSSKLVNIILTFKGKDFPCDAKPNSIYIDL